ncbi:MAG: preprotein translocase subunit SecA [Chlamydiales bacterium]|nr:preprotein translocase subunit SecA [Chlamydiales bacterium]
MLSFLKFFLGSAQDRQLKKYKKTVEDINAFFDQFKTLSEQELKEKTIELKSRLGEENCSIDDLLPEAYAVVKSMCSKICGQEIDVSGYQQKWDMIPYDVQLVGAIAMHHKSISEMQTGEGKTLTAVLPLYLNALTGKPVHLVTVNDYLAQRDCQWVGVILRKLGLTTAALISGMPPEERRAAYACDVVYGTASEFGFDYLRDNSTASRPEELVQRGHYFAIVDEADSIFIDEARTPLIISGPVPDSQQMYESLKEGVSQLVKSQRDLCNRLATEAHKILTQEDFFDSEESHSKSFKDLSVEAQKATQKLWMVRKGTPRHKILKRALENPALRNAIDQWDLYYYSEQNKEEKSKALAELFIIIDEKSSDYELTDKGISKWTSENDESSDDFLMLDITEHFYEIDKDKSLSQEEKELKKANVQEEDRTRKERTHNLRQLLRAHLLMEKDVDYIIQNNKVVIIDENTGRPQPGRRFSDGLHQAIEAKESVSIQQETQTYATITLQNYFRLYEKLAGMSGTAVTEAQELKETYDLEVYSIPTHKKCQRSDANDEIYMTEREKYQAILKEIREKHDKNRPILVGTESVEVSEKLSRILKQNKLEHTVLNARNHAKEAEIVASAGQRKAITISTNMAGRGTDIKLDAEAKEAGGLHVIGTTRHNSRRIDRQLRGRCARQGDPGSSKFYISFEDTLMRLFAPPKMTDLLKRLRPPEGEPISAGILNRSIETAQKRIEQRNYMIRKHTLEYDDVMNRQRKEIYSYRHEILLTDSLQDLVKELFEDVSWEIFDSSSQNHAEAESAIKESIEYLNQHFPISLHSSDVESQDSEAWTQHVAETLSEAFHNKIGLERKRGTDLETQGVHFPSNFLDVTVKEIMVKKIDSMWQQHLLAMDNLRSDVQMRTVGQKDPLMEFKTEAFTLFEELSLNLKKEIAQSLFCFQIIPLHEDFFEQKLQQISLEKNRNFSFGDDVEASQTGEDTDQDNKVQPIMKEPSTKRNEVCPCGSGKKYKKCCGKVPIA